MAESTLSYGYGDLSILLGRYLGLGDAWAIGDSDEEDEKVNRIIKSGLNRFYNLISTKGRVSHRWSFLHPVVTLETIAPYDTGTIAIVNGTTTVTLTDGVFPSWTATHGSLIVDTAEYVIDTRTDDTHLELASAWSEDTETASEYVLKHDGNYDLPDNFGGMESDMVIESENFRPNIMRVGEGKIRSLRQLEPRYAIGTTTTTPFYAAIRPKEHTVTTTGQRFEVMFHPLPPTVITISYQIRILPEMLVATTLEYPYGGAEHGETIRAACLAAAEEQENSNRLGGNKSYDKRDLFESALVSSIALDNQINSVEFYGYNGDNSDMRHQYHRNDHHRHCDSLNVTYNGEID